MKAERGRTATLRFPLPECKEELELALNAGKMYCALWDFQELLRTKCKYTSEKDFKDKLEAYEEIRNLFYETLVENKVEL